MEKAKLLFIVGLLLLFFAPHTLVDGLVSDRLDNGNILAWPWHPTYITYCIETSDSSLDYASAETGVQTTFEVAIGAAFAAAALAWSDHCGVTFEKRSCNDMPMIRVSHNVLLSAQASTTVSEALKMCLPYFSRGVEEIHLHIRSEINEFWPLPECANLAQVEYNAMLLRSEDGVLINAIQARNSFVHEIGHILGFVHEHQFNPNKFPSCDYDRKVHRPPSEDYTFDPLSVMAYGGGCGGTTKEIFNLSARDIEVAQSVYGMPSKVFGRLSENTEMIAADVPNFPEVASHEFGGDRSGHSIATVQFAARSKPLDTRALPRKPATKTLPLRVLCGIKRNGGAKNFCASAGLSHVWSLRLTPALERSLAQCMLGRDEDPLAEMSEADFSDVVDTVCVCPARGCGCHRVTISMKVNNEEEIHLESSAMNGLFHKEIPIIDCHHGAYLPGGEPMTTVPIPVQRYLSRKLVISATSPVPIQYRLLLSNVVLYSPNFNVSRSVNLDNSGLVEGEQLDSIFQSLDHRVWELSMVSNRLQDFPRQNLESFSSLTHLDLSNNNIRKIESQIPVSIKHLRLRANLLTSFLADDLVEDPESQLTFLDLSDNHFEEVPRSLRKFKHLREVLLSKNSLVELGSDLKHIPSLQRLDVSENRITTLPSGQLMPHLRTLNFAKNRLSTFNARNIFLNFPMLSSLDLSGNPIKQMSDFECGPQFRSLSLQAVGSESLHLRNCGNLTNLNVNHNKLASLTSDSSLRELAILRASNNRLRDLDILEQIDEDPKLSSPKLELLDVSYNNLTEVGLKKFTNLEIINANSNRIHSAEIPWDGLNLSVVSFRRNEITQLADYKCGADQPLFRRRKSPTRQFTLVDFAHNKLSSVSPGFFVCLGEIEKFDLTGNLLTSCPSVSAATKVPRGNRGSEGVHQLSFKSNRLGMLSWCFTLGEIRHLSLLDLSDNQIVLLTPGTFPTLKSLNLARNKLRHFDVSFLDGFPRLETIDLSGNRLDQLYRGRASRKNLAQSVKTHNGNVRRRYVPPLYIDASATSLPLKAAQKMIWFLKSQFRQTIWMDVCDNVQLITEVRAALPDAVFDCSNAGRFLQWMHIAFRPRIAVKQLGHDYIQPFIFHENLEELSLANSYSPLDRPHHGLPKLRVLVLTKVQSLQTLPTWFGGLSALTHLSINDCFLRTGLKTVWTLPNLEHLSLYNNDLLKWEFPETPRLSLRQLLLGGVHAITDDVLGDPRFAESFPRLEILDVSATHIRELPSSLGDIRTLRFIKALGFQPGYLSHMEGSTIVPPIRDDILVSYQPMIDSFGLGSGRSLGKFSWYMLSYQPNLATATTHFHYSEDTADYYLEPHMTADGSTSDSLWIRSRLWRDNPGGYARTTAITRMFQDEDSEVFSDHFMALVLESCVPHRFNLTSQANSKVLVRRTYVSFDPFGCHFVDYLEDACPWLESPPDIDNVEMSSYTIHKVSTNTSDDIMDRLTASHNATAAFAFRVWMEARQGLSLQIPNLWTMEDPFHHTMCGATVRQWKENMINVVGSEIKREHVKIPTYECDYKDRRPTHGSITIRGRGCGGDFANDTDWSSVDDIHFALHMRNELAPPLPIPLSVFKATGVKTAKFSGMGLTDIPEEMANWQKLRVLDLANNRFSVFPKVLTRLTALERVEFHRNLLESFDADLSALTRLNQLNLESNFLKSFPALRSPSLIILRLDGNHLSTFDPSPLSLPNLGTLVVGTNPIKHFICGTVLRNLTVLAISQTPIADIPACAPEVLPNLRALKLSMTLVSNISHEWKFPHMELIDARHSRIESVDGLTQMPKLRDVNLSYNRIRDLPQDIGKLSHLYSLTITENALRSLPASLANITTLQNIQVSQNLITSVPDELLKSNATAIILSRNPITELSPDLQHRLFSQKHAITDDPPQDVRDLQASVALSIHL